MRAPASVATSDVHVPFCGYYTGGAATTAPAVESAAKEGCS